MKKRMKKLLTVFLATSMMCSVSSVASFAEEPASQEAGSQQGAGQNVQETEYAVTLGYKMIGVKKVTVTDSEMKIYMASESQTKFHAGQVGTGAKYATTEAMEGEIEAESMDGVSVFTVPLSQVKAGEVSVWSFYSKKNKEWNNRIVYVDVENKTVELDPYTSTSDFESSTLLQGKFYIQNHNSPKLVDELIDAIYVQQRNKFTDKMCELAKYAWDNLTEEQKEQVEEGDYFGRDTGDASLDNPRNTAPDKEKELLVVSFGTSFNDSRAKDIGGVEDALEKKFGSEYSVRRAFTAQIIINHVQSREDVKIDNVEQAMEKAVAAGVKEMIVQPTHLMYGAEYDELKETIDQYQDKIKVSYAEPLLGTVGKTEDDLNADKENVMKAVSEAAAGAESSKLSAEDSDTAYVFMGHGTNHAANITYAQMQKQAEKLGYKNVYIITVEDKEKEETAENYVKDFTSKLQTKGYQKIVLRPLMVVAGDHANNDMAGEEEDSWKSIIEEELGDSVQVECQIEGLGRIAAVQDIYAAHTSAVIDKQKKEQEEAEAAAKKAAEEEAAKKAAAEQAKAIARTKAAKVTGVKAKANKKGHSVKVSWKKSASFDTYKVYRQTGKKWKLVKTTKSASATIKGQKKGKKYSFKVMGTKKIAGQMISGKYSKTVKVKAK